MLSAELLEQHRYYTNGTTVWQCHFADTVPVKKAWQKLR